MPIELPRLGSIKKEALKPKICQYPDCGASYMGTGFSKFCLEHRKPEYKKTKPEEVVDDRNNQIYTHNLKEAQFVTFTCVCGKPFEVLVFPNTYVVSKYCEEHRNEFRRENF